MNILHSQLCASFSWYERWHKNPLANKLSWTVFAAFALAYTGVLTTISHDISSMETRQLVPLAQVAMDRSHADLSAVELRIKEVTDTALARANDHARSALGQAASRKEELRTALEARTRVLNELALTEPQTVRRYVMNEQVIGTLPEDLRSYAEKPFRGKGVYQVYLVSETFGENEKSHEEYFLEVPGGGRYRLAITRDEAVELEPERSVTVTGVEFNDNVVVPTEFDQSDDDTEELVLGASTVKNIAVILFNFRNNPTQTLASDEINRRFFTNANSVAAHMRENSEGKWDIQGKVFNWVTLDIDTTGVCDYYGFATKAKEKLTAAGENLSGYTNFHYLFPVAGTGCSWGGIANMPGSQSWVIADYFGSGGISTHELGHNYGFHHAGTPGAEYGDGSDPMGGARPVHYSNYNKGRYWLSADKFTTVTSSGTYTLNELKSTSTGIVGIRIPRQDGTTNHLLLEYRGLGGFDNGLASTYANKVLVRVVPSTFTTALTTQIAAIAPGGSFTSTVDGITISVPSTDGARATVNVQMTAPPCVTANPTMTASPSAQWGAPGQALTYNVTVRNNNSSSCAPEVFTVIPTLPSGFTQLPDSGSITVGSGAQGTFTFSLTSPQSAVPATYTFTERVTSVSDSTKSASVSLNYNIAAPDSTAPVVSITAPQSGAKVGSKATVSASASDQSGIASIQILIDGAVMKTCSSVTSCSYSWSTRKVPAGSHTIRAVAVDASAYRNQGQNEIVVTK